MARELAGDRALQVTCLGNSSMPAGFSEAASADITRPDALSNALEGRKFDAVVHCAGLAHQFGATAPGRFHEVNVTGTANVCRAAGRAGARHLVLLSSVSVYGSYGERLVDESFDCRPEGAYAESKLNAERTAVSYCAENGIELTILRLATVVGAGDRGNVARLIRAIDRRRFVWIGQGANRKTLVPAPVVASAVSRVLSVAPDRAAGVFNLALEPLTMREIVETAARALGRRIFPISIPAGLVLAGLDLLASVSPRAGQMSNSVKKWISSDLYCGAEFMRRFAFRPAVTVGQALQEEARAISGTRR